MSFHEKSALIMSVVLSLLASVYFTNVFLLSENGQLITPSAPSLLVFSIVLIVVAIMAHIVVAAVTPEEAKTSLDERAQRIHERAGHLSAKIFGVGVVLSLMIYLVSFNGSLLFYTVFASLIIGHIVEYLTQLYLYRAVMH